MTTRGRAVGSRCPDVREPRRPAVSAIRVLATRYPLLPLQFTVAYTFPPNGSLAPRCSLRSGRPRGPRALRDRRTLDRRWLSQRTAPLSPQGVLGGVRRFSS